MLLSLFFVQDGGQNYRVVSKAGRDAINATNLIGDRLYEDHLVSRRHFADALCPFLQERVVEVGVPVYLCEVSREA